MEKLLIMCEGANERAENLEKDYENITIIDTRNIQRYYDSTERRNVKCSHASVISQVRKKSICSMHVGFFYF